MRRRSVTRPKEDRLRKAPAQAVEVGAVTDHTTFVPARRAAASGSSVFLWAVTSRRLGSGPPVAHHLRARPRLAPPPDLGQARRPARSKRSAARRMTG